jgi:hypothetical protein
MEHHGVHELHVRDQYALALGQDLQVERGHTVIEAIIGIAIIVFINGGVLWGAHIWGRRKRDENVIAVHIDMHGNRDLHRKD